MASLSFGAWRSRKRPDVNATARRRLGFEPLEGRCLLASPVYTAGWTYTPIQVDGRLDEPAWSSARILHKFMDFEDVQKPADPGTTVRLLWDRDYLYVGYEIVDQHIGSAGLGHDGNLYTGDSVELFLKPEAGDTPYYEFEFSPNPDGKTVDVMDVLYPSRNDRDTTSRGDYESGLIADLEIRGTLGDDSDLDTGWTLEVAIPRSKLADFKVGDRWSFLAARNDFPASNAGDPLLSFTSTESAPGFHQYEVYNPLLFNIQPKPTLDSDLGVRVELVGTMPASQAGLPRTNATSPVPVGSKSDLLLIDQYGYVYHWDGARSRTLLSPESAPAGLTLFLMEGTRKTPLFESILNIAANAAGDRVFVVYTSTTVPDGVPVTSSPPESRVRVLENPPTWQVVYEYQFDGENLSDPRAIRAFETGYRGHTGGGLAVLDDGTLLYGIGDTRYPWEFGGTFPQDPSNHLGKILHIRPADGSFDVVAMGFRNPQRFAVYRDGDEPYLYFVDIGSNVAEELNVVAVASLLDPTAVENFGWGKRDPGDGKAREGTFYIDATVRPFEVRAGGYVIGVAPTPEPGFLQPTAQWGFEGRDFVAATGPVSSAVSFTSIRSLFGDLVSGSVYAITGSTSAVDQDVFQVNLFDVNSQSTSLSALAGGRPDPRFFNFPDGSAGVLLEATGAFYRLTQIPMPVTSRYDFGTASSPLAAGYTRVTAATAYTPAAGFGWVAGTILDLDRGPGSDLTRDFNYTADGTFAVDLADGTYTVSLTLGDTGPYAHDLAGVFLQGEQVDTVSTDAGEVVTRTYVVAVAGGRLTLRLRDLGGGDPYDVIMALEVTPGGTLPPPPPPPPPPPTSPRYDFGTASSPLAAGYTRVTAATAYTPAAGFGWVAGTILDLDRGPGTDLTRDFNYTADGTFAVDLADGTYTVSLTLGDTGPYAHDQAGVFLEGAQVDTVSTAAGQVVTRSYVVSVADGQLTLRLRDLGGGDPYDVIMALEITPGGTLPPPPPPPPPPSTSPRYDFGTASSPLAAGYTRVTAATAYTATAGFGWVAGTILDLDRGPGTDLTRDFNYTADGTFAVDLADGTYTVSLTLGDTGPYAHDQAGVFLEGAQVDTVSTAAGQVVTRSYVVSVADGQLTLRLRDLGGGDPYDVIMALEITPGATPTVTVALTGSPLADAGGLLSGKAWQDSTSEPSGWMFLQSGWMNGSGGFAGLNGGSGRSTTAFDDFTVSTVEVSGAALSSTTTLAELVASAGQAGESASGASACQKGVSHGTTTSRLSNSD